MAAPVLREARADAPWILLAVALLFALDLGGHDLWNPNEPSYGRVVVEMLERDDWLVPRINGEAFGEKPVLAYWLAAASSWLAGGVSESTLRAPMVATGIGATLLAWLLTLLYAGRSAARYGAAVFATVFMVWWHSRTLQMDSPLLLGVMGAITALCLRLDGGWPARRSWLLAGLAMGFGFSAKGPVAIIVPALVLGACCGTERDRWRCLISGLHWGALGFALTGLPWYLALAIDGQWDLLRDLLLRQNVQRFVDAWDHFEPWYFYLKDFWLSFAPWSWFVPIAVWARPRDEMARRGRRLACAWILLPMLFFSFSESKREPYLMSQAAAIALLVGPLLARHAAGIGNRFEQWGVILLAIFTAGLWLAAVALVTRAPLREPRLVLDLPVLQGALLMCAVIVATPLLVPRWRRALPAGLVAGWVLFYGAATLLVLPAVDAIKTHRVFAQRALQILPQGARLYSFFGPNDRQFIRGGYPYYMQRDIPHLDTPEELSRAWRNPAPICLLVELWPRAPELPDLPGAQLVLDLPIGSKRARLLCR